MFKKCTRIFMKDGEALIEGDKESEVSNVFPQNLETTPNDTPYTQARTTITGLTVHMLVHRHARLNTAIYGEEYGMGLRKLDLILESEERLYEILVPVTTQYDRSSNPIVTCDTLKREEWDELCEFVREIGVFKMVLSSADGKHRFLARMTVKGEGYDKGIGAMQMDVMWKSPTMKDLEERDSRLSLS